MDGVKTTTQNGLRNSLMIRGVLFLILVVLVCVGGWSYRSHPVSNPFVQPLLTKTELRDKIAKLNNNNIYSYKQNEVKLEGFNENVVLDYAFDPNIQSIAEDLLSQYKPDLGVMVAMDPTTGRILAMTGVNRAFDLNNLDPSLSATFPSASVFKVVTAAAAIEERKANPNSLIPYSGRDHTLYKSQMKDKVSGWRRISSLKSAFAKSINTVFGRLGVFAVGREPLKTFSSKFGFGESIPAEFPILTSQSANPEDDFELAEMASGYTQRNVMSAIHGVMIAAAVANDGVMMQPYFLNSAYLKSGKPVYKAEPAVFSNVMSPETAGEVRTLMRETVTAGTSRKVFHGFFKGKFSGLEVGGKTGHLTDQKLNGRIDWFVGFAQNQGRKIAISVLTMHKKYWTVKSAYLARRAIETAFTQKKVVAR